MFATDWDRSVVWSSGWSRGAGCYPVFSLHIAHQIAGSAIDPGAILLKMGLQADEYSLSVDGSYGEWFEYLLLAIIVMTLARAAHFSRQSIYLALILIFIFCLADNALRLHERLGGHLADHFALTPALHLRAKDYGEMGAWATCGIPLLAYLLHALHRSEGRHRLVGLTLTKWFLLLAFFGAAGDMLHSAVRGLRALDSILGFLEDGGEMAVIVVIVALCLAVHSYLRKNEAGYRSSRYRFLPIAAQNGSAAARMKASRSGCEPDIRRRVLN